MMTERRRPAYDWVYALANGPRSKFRQTISGEHYHRLQKFGVVDPIKNGTDFLSHEFGHASARNFARYLCSSMERIDFHGKQWLLAEDFIPEFWRMLEACETYGAFPGERHGSSALLSEVDYFCSHP